MLHFPIKVSAGKCWQLGTTMIAAIGNHDDCGFFVCAPPPPQKKKTEKTKPTISNDDRVYRNSMKTCRKVKDFVNGAYATPKTIRITFTFNLISTHGLLTKILQLRL